MKRLTYSDIVALSPCYDPIKHISSTWQGTLIDVLKLQNVPAKDRLWVTVRADFMTDKQLHQYGQACARMCETNSDDPRVKVCNDVVEAFFSGMATKEQLADAESAARSAAWSIARSAAWSTTRSAESATKSAAWSAAESAVWSAESATRSATKSAESAARSAESAARSAAWSAESAARSAAGATAWSDAEEKQCEILIKILEEIE